MGNIGWLLGISRIVQYGSEVGLVWERERVGDELHWFWGKNRRGGLGMVKLDGTNLMVNERNIVFDY